MPNEYIYLLYSVNKSKSARVDTKPYLIYSVYIFFKLEAQLNLQKEEGQSAVLQWTVKGKLLVSDSWLAWG